MQKITRLMVLSWNNSPHALSTLHHPGTKSTRNVLKIDSEFCWNISNNFFKQSTFLFTQLGSGYFSSLWEQSKYGFIDIFLNLGNFLLCPGAWLVHPASSLKEEETLRRILNFLYLWNPFSKGLLQSLDILVTSTQDERFSFCRCSKCCNSVLLYRLTKGRMKARQKKMQQIARLLDIPSNAQPSPSPPTYNLLALRHQTAHLYREYLHHDLHPTFT